MNYRKLKRAMLTALMITMLFSLTGCFIQPIPVVESQANNADPALSLPTTEAASPLPTVTVSGDFSAWATDAPVNLATQTPMPTSTTTPPGSSQTPAPTLIANTSSPLSAAVPEETAQTVLKEGSEGPQVRELQQRLMELGYYDKSVDGSFGPATAAALKDFQKANGLSADGLAGPKTMEVLHSGDAKRK